MTRREISDGVGNISSRHILEAADYKTASQKIRFFKRPVGRTTAAAVLALCLIAGLITGTLLDSPGGMAVTAYAYGTGEEIPEAGAVIRTGTISDSGEMAGHPLMFYLSGKNIVSVRYSCKNEQLEFMDWTEKRDEYGLAQNFTISYGEEDDEYASLLIDWVPNTIIRELTDHSDSSIASLPEEMRNDVIVMEITFGNEKTAVKAIQVSLLDDGTFFASFSDYQISETDAFVKRPDSAPLSASTPSPETDGNTLAEDTESSMSVDMEGALVAAKATAEAYYKKTVFQVISMEAVDQTVDQISFSVRVTKDGVLQDPDRTIWLQLINGSWEVVNEGY